ncbi:single-stranded DNA-binding protein [Heliorestis acidaminivorans]|uniref:Single-stranded DNA-binding protein n=1 Tax=Heliorestis acidaminivorans TaxID=553427 RepID=A0A6I0F5B4_9FIRM|nr:single-stranded DNA-binding protein [Heliorestis acidaminivorans]KAB2953867.1 single-stranded DNA-binding protein [Heliorestis acidaminivorans]
MLNRVILIGRLGQDPELRHTNSGTPVCTFNIAIDRPQSQAQRQSGAEKITDWIRIVVWDQQAISCSQYLHKGRLVAIDGRIQINSWTDQQSGQKRSMAEVVAETVRFLERGENQGQQNAMPGGYGRQAYGGGQPPYPANPSYPGGPGGSSFQGGQAPHQAPPYQNKPFQPSAPPPLNPGPTHNNDFPDSFGSEISFPDHDDNKDDDLPF